MVSLVRDSRGNHKARKRLPSDVREEYGRLYGARFEAKFFAPASKKPHEAKRLFYEWQSEADARIAAIRAQRNGEGISLIPQQVRALAGEWYDWFIARYPVAGQEKWEDLCDIVQDALREFVGDKEWEGNDPQ
ncbi:MAG: hypothetical protein WCD13_07000 [Pseudolabrys sp.]